MPNRIIKETICTSEDINRLSPMAECLFYRLMVKADDFGTYYGNGMIIKSTCFPLKDITITDIRNWVCELISAGLVYLYEADDKRWYIQFVKWEKHQQVRATRRRFPPCNNICNQLISDDSGCCRIRIRNNTTTSNNNNINNSNSINNEYIEFPTLEEVREYCRERNSSVDPDRFFSYYNEGDWRDANGNPVLNWKQKLISWEQKDDKKPRGRNIKASCNNYPDAKEQLQRLKELEALI